MSRLALMGAGATGGAGVASITRYRDAVVADAPVAYWRLQEASGTVATDSVGTFNGTYQAAPTLGVASPISDTGAKAVTFNGTTQYVNTAAVPTTVIDNYALECWVKLTSATSQTGMFLKCGNGTTGYGIGIGDGTGAAGLKLTGLLAGVVWQPTAYTFADTLWHYIVMTRELSVTKIYIDNVAQTVTNNGNPGNAPAGDAEIAAEAGARFAAATIAEPAIYNTALTATKVATHWGAR